MRPSQRVSVSRRAANAMAATSTSRIHTQAHTVLVRGSSAEENPICAGSGRDAGLRETQAKPHVRDAAYDAYS
jgi:hypothetical protein